MEKNQKKVNFYIFLWILFEKHSLFAKNMANYKECFLRKIDPKTVENGLF